MVCLVLAIGKTVTAPTIWLALKAIGLGGLTTRIRPSKKGSFIVDYAARTEYNERRKKDVIVWNFLGEFAAVEQAKPEGKK